MHRLTASQIHRAFLKGELSAKAIAEHFLKRIQLHDPKIGAFLSILETKVLLKAEELDRKRSQNQPLGKLAAVPIAIKDNMHIQGEITSCASQMLKNYRAPFDATVVRLFEEEDALLLGKTNLDEFAMGSSNENSSFFPAQNPWNLKCVPGGSSGGSAASVAARLSLIATGSDTGGSIRQPAALCGVVGFKPTYGRVSRYGLVAFGSSLDQIGPIATSVEDIAMTMNVIGRHCPHDATSLELPPENYPLKTDLNEITFAIPKHFIESSDPEVQTNFLEAVSVMKELGAKIIEVDLSILKYSIAVYQILATAEASTNLARFDGIRYGLRSKSAKDLTSIYQQSRHDGFGNEVKRRIMLGTFVLSSGCKDAYYTKAQKVRTLIIEAFQNIFQTSDALLLPTTSSSAFEKGSIQDPLDLYLQDIFTIPANLAGLPAISVPSGYDKKGLPLGLQIIGPELCDTSIIQYAYAYEQKSRHAKIPSPYEK